MNSLIKRASVLICISLAISAPGCNSQKDQVTPPTPPAPPPQTETITPPSVVRGFMSGRMENVSNASISEMKAWGANVVRFQIFPVRWAKSRNQDIWEALPAYLDELKLRIDYAASLGIKSVIDLHEPPVMEAGDVTTPAFWNIPGLKPNFIKIWQMIAMRFKDPAYNNRIWGYDFYNEPVEKVANTTNIPYKWRAMALDIVAAIRAIDADVWVIYEPGPWGNTLGYMDVQPLADKRVIYSIHFYTPQSSFTHQGVSFPSSVTTREQALTYIGKEYPGTHNNKYWNKQALAEDLKLVDDFQKKYNVPIFVGEFSVIRWAPVASSVQWLKDATELFEERGWSWCYHAFREWNGWDLEFKEGTGEFWFEGDPAPQKSAVETERAKVIKAALQKNQ